MKSITPSSRSLLLALGLLVLTACSGGDDHGHDHGPDADHSHEADDAHDHGNDDDHGHDHADGDDHHDHVATGEPILGFVLPDAPVAGQPFTFSLILSDTEGRPVSADDLATTHDHKLHVLIVDEALEDYQHMHPEIGPDGLYQLTFTPEYARTYQVWADYKLTESSAHDHGEDDHSHGDDDHHDHGDDHHADHGAAITVSEALIVGAETGPVPSSEDVLTATAGGLTYTLTTDGALTPGTERLIVSVKDSSGTPYEALEPIMDAYAHLVGFNAGATAMAHAHPVGDHPHGANSRGGPDLQFDVAFEDAGPHRLFLQTVAGGQEQLVSFNVNLSE